MLTKIIIALCLSFLVAVVNAAVGSMKIPPTPEELAHKEGCYIKEINDVITLHTNVSLVGICEARFCYEDRIEIETCGERSVKDTPGCFLTEKDYSRPFDACCPQVRCDLGENQIAG